MWPNSAKSYVRVLQEARVSEISKKYSDGKRPMLGGSATTSVPEFFRVQFRSENLNWNFPDVFERGERKSVRGRCVGAVRLDGHLSPRTTAWSLLRESKAGSLVLLHPCADCLCLSSNPGITLAHISEVIIRLKSRFMAQFLCSQHNPARSACVRSPFHPYTGLSGTHC